MSHVAVLAGKRRSIETALTPARLRCELLIDPLAVADPRPRLSWVLQPATAEAKNKSQTAFQIQVSSQQGEKPDLWDSGKVESGRTFDIQYEGRQLQPFQTAYWRVNVWDEQGEESQPSQEAQWTQAPDEWIGEWIGFDAPLDRAKPISLEGAHWIWHADEQPMQSPPGTCFFRLEIELDDPETVQIFASADDRFTMRVNKEVVGRSDDELHAWSRPVLFDVLSQVAHGKNVIEAEVENCAVGAGAFIATVKALEKSEEVLQWQTDSSWQARKSESSRTSGSQRLAEYGGAPWGRLREPELFLPPPRYLRTRFDVPRPIRRATLYATALGIYSVELNGELATQDFFAPGWTDYAKRVHFRAYDVTGAVRVGDNAIGAVLMDGWFAGYIGFKPERDHYGERTRFSCMLVLDYEDGTTETVSTDGSWRAGTGPLRHADFLMGESCIDPGVMAGWSQAGYDDASWKPVDVGAELRPEIEPYPMQPCGCFAVLDPVSVVEHDDGSRVYDFGQNVAGVVEVASGPDAATPTTVRHAERLDEEGKLYTANLRSAKSTDVFQPSGEGRASTPRGTYHGFRYVETTGAHPKQVKAKALSNIQELACTFECSDERLNKLWSNICWTQRANFIEVPTDCPQRDERLGWTGDIQTYARTAALVADVQPFLRKWLTDLSDAQRKDGQYPMAAPSKVAGDDGGPAWSEAGVIVPWALYQVYEDTDVLERQYDSMVRFLSFCESRSADGRAPENYHCFGDWLNIGAATPDNVIFTAYFAHSADLMARIADVLGRDAAHYNELFAKARRAFQQEYVAEDGTVRGDTQTGYVLALAFDLLDEPLRTKATEKLVENVERHGRLTTGFVGTKNLMLVLRDIGRTDLAYRILLSDEYPGWLCSVKHGATTVWERWDGWSPEKGFADPAMNSFSHCAFGAVGQFMIETITGVRLLEPGYKRFLIAPEPGPLTSASASYESVRGRIATDWRFENGRFNLGVSVPPNTEAVVRLPSGEEKSVGSGEWKFESVPPSNA